MVAIASSRACARDAIHLIGHSSGGLDARLLATPGVSLPDGESGEPFASQVRSGVSVATPHRGTPSAELFSSLYGKGLLRLLWVATVFVVRQGHLPLALVLRLVDLWRKSLGQRRHGARAVPAARHPDPGGCAPRDRG